MRTITYLCCLFTFIIFLGCDKSSNDDSLPLNFTVTSLNPTQGKVGDTITITGTNFRSASSENVVDFDGVATNVISSSSTTIRAIVPIQLPEGISNVSLSIQGIIRTVGTYTVSNDDYKYLVVDHYKRVFTVGNNSTELLQIGRIEQSESKPIISRTLSNSETKIFGITNYFLEDEIELLIYDKTSSQTTAVDLVIPNSIIGQDKAILGLVWDEQNSRLIGLLDPNEGFNETEYHVVTINPITYEVIDTGIITPTSGAPIFSIVLSNNKIYYTAAGINSNINLDLVEIDMSTNNSTQYYFNDYSDSIYRMSKTNEGNKIFAFRTTIGTNAVIPIKIDLIQNEVNDLTPYNGHTIVTIDGNGYYDQNTNQTLNIIGNSSIGYSINKFNELGEELVNLEMVSGDNPSFYIIGIID